MTEDHAHDHIEHCDLLITGCLSTANGVRAMGVHITLDECLSGLDQLIIAETLMAVAASIRQQAGQEAQAN
jgi:hypothetical protein